MIDQCKCQYCDFPSDESAEVDNSSLSEVPDSGDTSDLKSDTSYDTKDNCDATSKQSPRQQNIAASGNMTSGHGCSCDKNTQNTADRFTSRTQVSTNETLGNKGNVDNVNRTEDNCRNSDSNRQLGGSDDKQVNNTGASTPDVAADNRKVTTPIRDKAGKIPDSVSQNRPVETLPEDKFEPAVTCDREKSTICSYCSRCSCCYRPRCCNYCCCYVCCRPRDSTSRSSVSYSNSKRNEAGEPPSKIRKLEENSRRNINERGVVNEKTERIYRNGNETIRVYDEEIDIRCKRRCDKPTGEEVVGPQNATFTVYERTIKPRNETCRSCDKQANETCRACRTSDKKDTIGRQSNEKCRDCRTYDRNEGLDRQSNEACRICGRFDTRDKSYRKTDEMCRICRTYDENERPKSQTNGTCRVCRDFNKQDSSDRKSSDTLCRACKSYDKRDDLHRQTNETCQICRCYDKHDGKDKPNEKCQCRVCRSYDKHDANEKRKPPRSSNQQAGSESPINDTCRACRAYDKYDPYYRKSDETCHACRSYERYNGSDGYTSEVSQVKRNEKTRPEKDINIQKRPQSIRAPNVTRATQTNFSDSESYDSNSRDPNTKATQTYKIRNQATSTTSTPETSELSFHEAPCKDCDEGRAILREKFPTKKTREKEFYKDDQSYNDPVERSPKAPKRKYGSLSDSQRNDDQCKISRKTTPRKDRIYKNLEINEDHPKKKPKEENDKRDYKSPLNYKGEKPRKSSRIYDSKYYKSPLPYNKYKDEENSRKSSLDYKGSSSSCDKSHKAPSTDKYRQYHHNAYLNYYVRLFRQEKFHGIPATVVAKYAGVQWRSHLSEKEKRPYYQMRKFAPPRVRKKRRK